MEKKENKTPKIEIIEFEAEDVVGNTSYILI